MWFGKFYTRFGVGFGVGLINLFAIIRLKAGIVVNFYLKDNYLLTVGLPEIWDTLEIQKMKICSEVPNFMGKMNFQSKCAEVSWLLRYSVFSVFTKISWQSFFQNCEITELGTTFLEISLDLAYSKDSKNGLTFENW